MNQPTLPTPLKVAIVLTGRLQRDIAAEIGVNEVTLSRIVRGGHATQDMRQRIAVSLGREISELWPDVARSDAA